MAIKIIAKIRLLFQNANFLINLLSNFYLELIAP